MRVCSMTRALGLTLLAAAAPHVGAEADGVEEVSPIRSAANDSVTYRTRPGHAHNVADDAAASPNTSDHLESHRDDAMATEEVGSYLRQRGRVIVDLKNSDLPTTLDGDRPRTAQQWLCNSSDSPNSEELPEQLQGTRLIPQENCSDSSSDTSETSRRESNDVNNMKGGLTDYDNPSVDISFDSLNDTKIKDDALAEDEEPLVSQTLDVDPLDRNLSSSEDGTGSELPQVMSIDSTLLPNSESMSAAKKILTTEADEEKDTLDYQAELIPVSRAGHSSSGEAEERPADMRHADVGQTNVEQKQGNVSRSHMSTSTTDELASDPMSVSIVADSDDGTKEKDDEEEDEDGPIKKLVNYAHKSAGAIILGSSPSLKGTSNLLVSDNDKYAIAPCSEKRSIVISLSEDILVKQVVLSNYEKYSSSVKEFQLLGTQSYNVDAKSSSAWTDLGTYTAKPTPSEQTFNLVEPSWARYLKFRFLTHYGVEHYCTITQIKVHGSTMLQGFHEQWKESEMEAEKIRTVVSEDSDDEEIETEVRISATTQEKYFEENEGAVIAKGMKETVSQATDQPMTVEKEDLYMNENTSSADAKGKADAALQENRNVIDSEASQMNDRVDSVKAFNETDGKQSVKGRTPLHEKFPKENQMLTNKTKVNDRSVEELTQPLSKPKESTSTALKDEVVDPSSVTSSIPLAQEASEPISSSAVTDTTEGKGYEGKIDQMTDEKRIEDEDGASNRTDRVSTDTVGDAVSGAVNMIKSIIKEKIAVPTILSVSNNTKHMNGTGLEDGYIRDHSHSKIADDEPVEVTVPKADSKKLDDTKQTKSASTIARNATAGKPHADEESNDILHPTRDAISNETESLSSVDNAVDDVKRITDNRENKNSMDFQPIPPQKQLPTMPDATILDAVLRRRYHSLACLEGLNFNDFKNKVLARASKTKQSGADGSGSSGTISKPSLKMEPIFKTLTDEIKALQVNQSIYDQYLKALNLCYHQIVLEVLKESEQRVGSQESRLGAIEADLKTIREQRSPISALWRSVCTVVESSAWTVLVNYKEASKALQPFPCDVCRHFGMRLQKWRQIIHKKVVPSFQRFSSENWLRRISEQCNFVTTNPSLYWSAIACLLLLPCVMLWSRRRRRSQSRKFHITKLCATNNLPNAPELESEHFCPPRQNLNKKKTGGISKSHQKSSGYLNGSAVNEIGVVDVSSDSSIELAKGSAKRQGDEGSGFPSARIASVKC